MICRRHSDPAFYALYRDVFDLTDLNRVIRRTWPLVKGEVLEITRLWGDSAHDFFVNAVDSDFQWRQNAGILTVYRLYIPIIGAPEHGIFARLDEPEWANQHRDLLQFLGLDTASSESVAALIERVDRSCK